MTVQDALNRGYNLVSTTVVALSGLAFAPELPQEDEWAAKIDEIVFILIAIGIIVWYFIGRNRFSRTNIPILFAVADLVMKLVAAFVLEAGDRTDIGDEYAGILLFVITVIFLIWQYVNVKRLAETAKQEELAQ
jgi:hypothetical protein